MRVLRELIERSADPRAAAVAIERLCEADGELVARVEGDARLGDALVAVAASSRSMTQLLVSDRAAVDVLADLDRPLGPPPEDADELARWKRHELLRIAARDLLGVDDLDTVTASLSALADAVLGAAVRIAGDTGLAVIGMGKLGARELNYASDVDVLFVGEGDARRVLAVAARCFRVDANLRPEGRDGALVRSVESFEAYWARWAAAWEFQALLKARPVAGDRTIGEAFDRARQARLWSRPFTADDIRAVRTMKARSESLVAKRGLTEREIKLGRGGIRDVEFAVQLLQLVHGRHDTALRVPATLDALAELAAAGYVDGGDASTLALAYRMLRTVEHRLQLVDEQQVHALPTDAGARARLARSIGLPGADDLDRTVRRYQAQVRAIHERLYFRPLLEAFAGAPGAMTQDAAEERLAAFGFADADKTRVALRELTRGLTRSSRLMQQLLPLLLGWLADTPDPDLGLLGLRTLASGSHRAARLVEAFRESPETARRLCMLVGTSRVLIRGLEQHPWLIRSLGDDTTLDRHGRVEMLDRVRSSVEWRGDGAARHRALQSLVTSERTRIAARDVLAVASTVDVQRELADLAEAVLEAALDTVAPDLAIAVIGMGRFGGGELAYASDLDVLFVHDAPDLIAEVEDAAERLLAFVNGSTPAARLFELDAALRPEGKQGPLARTLDGYATYYERWAGTWERQALVRARVVAGDRALGERFLALVEPMVWRGLTDDEAREIRRMKARVERERIPPSEDPAFHLKLGRGSLADIEWTAQLLQLQFGVRSPSTRGAIDALEEAGHLARADAAVLRESHAFCERTRNRWFLVKGGPGDSLPTQAPQLARLARSLGFTPTELREEYRRVTRRARAVVERVFYGGR